MSLNTKCIIVGDSGVGKSNLIMRYVNRIFVSIDPTIGVDYMTKHVEHMNHHIRISIWDVSGYQLYRD